MFRSKLRYLWTWFMDRNHFFKNIRVFSKYAPFYASSFSGSSSSDVSPHCNTPLCLTRCASPLWVPAVVVLWLRPGFWGRSPWAKTYGVTLTRARVGGTPIRFGSRGSNPIIYLPGLPVLWEAVRLGSNWFNLWPFRIKTDHRQTKWDMLALWIFSLSFQGGPPNGSPVGPFYVENLNFPAIKWGDPFQDQKSWFF